MDVTTDPRAIAPARDRSRLIWMAAGVLAAIALIAVVLAAPSRATAAEAGPSVQAPAAILIDRVSGRTLYGQEIHQRRPMASTTKIMTALLVVQRCESLAKTVRAPSAVNFCGGIGLEPGEPITLRQALLAMMLKSANDAAATLTVAVAGSEDAFVRLMNAKARRLGLRDTHYQNATGSHRDPRHYSTVYDLAKLARHAMRNLRFRELVGRREAVIRWGAGRERLVRPNNLLLHFDWADGVKSGFTPVAGYCLVASGRPGLRPLISATLKAPDREQNARDHLALYEWGSSLYEEATVVLGGEEVAVRPVAAGGEVHVAARGALRAVVRSAAGIRRTLDLPARFARAPSAGRVVGSATFRADGVVLGTVKLVVAAPPAEPSPSPPAGPEPTSAP